MADPPGYARLRDLLVTTLGLDWKNPAGFPDGHEVAEDCARTLWDAGLRDTEQITALCDRWDTLTKGQTGTTKAIRDALDLPHDPPRDAKPRDTAH